MMISRPLWIGAFLGACLLWMALPPVDWWPLAWMAPVPWVWLIRRQQLDGRRPYAMLTLAGFCFWMAALHWMRLPHWATSFGWVALSFYFAFYLPVFVGLSRVAVHRLHIPVMLAAPVVWTGLELARGHLLTGMTMASLGHTQYRWVELIQLSDLAGAYGVSFVVMGVAAALARMLPCDDRRGCFWPLAPAAAMLAAALVYGAVRMTGDYASPGPRITLVQGSIDVKMQYDSDMRDRIFREYYDRSRATIAEYFDVDLMVWPESMYPSSLATLEPNATRPAEFDGTEADFLDWPKQSELQLGQMARSLGVPLLLGTAAYHFGPAKSQCFNSAVYVGGDGRLLGRYDKMHLVMFGEYVPLAQYFPWLQRLTPLPISTTPGDKPAAFDLGGVRIAPNICYESVLSHVIRRQVNELAAEGQSPDVLVNLTNDGWYWGSSELDMHLVCGVFRAVECRKPFLIAANTGFSAWIDGDGRILKQGPRRATGTIVANVRLDHRHSWYLAHGDWFAGACLAACIVLAMVGTFHVAGTRLLRIPLSTPDPIVVAVRHSLTYG